MDAEFQPIELPELPATDYTRFVLDAVKAAASPTLNQDILRKALALASSFLITDAITGRSATWDLGLNQLVDLLVALHAKEELELETVNAASKACSECWIVAGMWRGLEDCREGVRTAGTKLKKLLDENGKTYRGEAVYSAVAPAPRVPPPRPASPAAEQP